ncbi:epidermal growth factor receptor kinase substrate 8 [Elysia marginata]|uniref:Epidermal growth factor receptor kinase substrate 8 n=1 Tax=Elysia marginata TaxID=1093978 RepID=A0AAV4FSZ9_9GAST|nr:epidermal growth factor receptor kinase substrate 8 [Elysia marginata]
MLNARARPPPDKDFVDIFQKFKLSFNLLAKLKAHIHDPNAPELVHFLFTPLSLIYEASRDPFHGNQNLGDQAVAPVLTADAKQLLNNCLTTKEVELWQALGKHWTTARDEWSGPIPPYVPEFYDGWQPAATIMDDMTARSLLSQPVDDRPPRNFVRAFPLVFISFCSHASGLYLRIYEAAHERTGKNEKELTVQKGDILQVLENSRNWWKLRNHKGQVGYAPYTILKPVKTDLDYNSDRGLTNGGGVPMSYRSDNNYIDDNSSSRRGVSRRGDFKYF